MSSIPRAPSWSVFKHFDSCWIYNVFIDVDALGCVNAKVVKKKKTKIIIIFSVFDMLDTIFSQTGGRKRGSN